MRIPFGNLYFDNDKSLSPEDKIIRFSERFKEKHRVIPTTCEVNPETFKLLVSDRVNNLEIFPSKLVQPNHFFIGTSEAFDTSKPNKNRTVEDLGVEHD